MEDSISQPQGISTPEQTIPQKNNVSGSRNVKNYLSTRKKFTDVLFGLFSTLVVYWIVSLIWRRIAYSVFAPSLEESGENFPGIIFFAQIAVIPIFAFLTFYLWKRRHYLALGFLIGIILVSLYFIASCSMTLAPGGCFELLF